MSGASSNDQAGETLWIPYGYHTIMVGYGGKSAQLFQPVCMDVLLQKVEPSLRKMIAEWNVGFIDANAKSKLVSNFGTGFRHWLSAAQ